MDVISGAQVSQFKQTDTIIEFDNLENLLLDTRNIFLALAN